MAAGRASKAKALTGQEGSVGRKTTGIVTQEACVLPKCLTPPFLTGSPVLTPSYIAAKQSLKQNLIMLFPFLKAFHDSPRKLFFRLLFLAAKLCL